ncbi:kinase-like domain-containing protein [Xylariaceae sp. AK1471]|nr:kinase-like domain-containing protein [Xylariaceae sp. AK1471]
MQRPCCLTSPRSSKSTSSDPSIGNLSSIRHTIFPLSDNPLPRKISTARINFITYLAVLQRLQVPILPITWDPERKLIGAGHTGRIAEASMSLNAGFAFKRIGDDEKARDAGTEIFLPLINETAILRHDHIEGHPNIPELEGICWDITPKDRIVTSDGRGEAFNIWPVLVFERSHYGDLYQFSQSPQGRKLSIGDRIKICLDVGNAIAAMQSHHIIHGDVKPQNVLIFASQFPKASVMAKVIDFSFSFWYGDDKRRIPVPRSWPWYAPECDEYPDFTPLEARKTDVFSYGMLCLWFLTEARLSSSQLCFDTTPNVAKSPLEFIARLKNQQLLLKLANKLLAEEAGIQAQSKLMLEKFFSSTLAYDPMSRCSSIQEALRHLDIEEARRTEYPSVNYLAYPDRMRRQVDKPLDPIEMPPAMDNDFNICNSLHDLYSSDYRLRISIIQCLREIIASAPSSIPLRNQLSLCRKLGFGGSIAKDDNLSAHDDITFTNELTAMLDSIAHSEKDEFKIVGTFHAQMETLGFSQRLSLVDIYRRDNVLEAAETVTRFEISHIEEALGPSHWISLLLRSELASIVDVQGRTREAEQLEIDLMQRSIKTLGRQHPDTLYRMSRLVSRYSHDGKLEDAEKLAIEVADLHIEVYSKHSPLTIEQIAELGRIYFLRGKLKEAEEVFTELIALDQREHGHEFPYTLNHMEDLAVIYKAQGNFGEAEKVLLQVSSSREASFGINDPKTLISFRSLASLYHQLGREKEAAALTRSIDAKLSVNYSEMEDK